MSSGTSVSILGRAHPLGSLVRSPTLSTGWRRGWRDRAAGDGSTRQPLESDHMPRKTRRYMWQGRSPVPSATRRVYRTAQRKQEPTEDNADAQHLCPDGVNNARPPSRYETISTPSATLIPKLSSF